MKWLVQSGVTCACDIDPVYGIHVATSTTFFSDGSTCTGAPGGCANQVMQGNWSNMVPWNLVDPNANSGYGQGAGTSFPGTGQLNGQIPIGIWSVDNTFSFTYGGNDFGEPYIWFTQHNWVNNDPSQGCVPNPANCIARVFEPNVIVNCCDPTESYQLTSTLIEHITGTGITLGVNQLGINTFTQAFRADLSIIGGTTTGYKCWHLEDESQPFGPTAYQGTPGSPTVFDTCTLLDNSLTNPCCAPTPLNECEPPFAKLAKLTSKLDNFIVWKNKSLGK